MEIRKIESFLKLAEVTNFSAAARALHISHQALSKQIQQMEQEIGEKLFERSTTKVSLTEIGKAAVKLYAPVYRDWVQAGARLQALIDERNHCLRVGYFAGLSYDLVVQPVLDHLTESDPRISISVLVADMNQLHRLYDQDMIDLAVTHGLWGQTWENSHQICLRTDPLYVIVSDRHPWYALHELTSGQLQEAVFLVYKNERPLEGKDAFFSELKVKKRMAAANLDTYMSMLRQGNCFGIVGPSYARREGHWKLLPLPEEYRKNHSIVLLYRNLHPQRELLAGLKDVVLDYDETGQKPTQD